MWRSFFTLYGVVVLALLLSFFAVSIPLQQHIERRVNDEVDRTTSGIFYLIERRFDGVAAADYDEVVDDLNRLFPYGVELLGDDEVAAMGLSRAAAEALAAGRVAFHGRPNPMVLKRLPAIGRVVKLNWGPTLEQDNTALTLGPVRLVERMLQPLPQARWGEVIDVLQPHFAFPIRLLRRDELTLPAALLDTIDRGRIATEKRDGNREVLYGRVLDSDLVFAAGPMVRDIRVSRFWLVAIAAVIVGIGILAWLSMLGRDVRRLDRATRAFGEGRLDTRVSLSRHSALAETGARFNAMAADIARLIDGSRELTNAVSHDLKTPLSRMRFALEMMRGSCADPNWRRHADSLEEDIDEIRALVEELLAHARYDRQLVLRRERLTDLGAWARRIVTRLAQPWPDLRVTVETAGDAPLAAELDPAAMARALRNVVVNALQHAAGEVRVGVAVARDEVRIVVDDDGPGIAAADRQRALTPFTRLDGSRARRGHGLGLAIAARIVAQHRGTVEIEDSPLGGARLILRWPGGGAR